MNDPWDVKSVRQAGQYVSCMRINGVPLLPPVLSRECRKEMQYYKLLAKEVEKRISQLKPYVIDSDTESSEDKTDAPEIPENEQNYELPQEDIQAGFNVNIEKITAVSHDTSFEKTLLNSPKSYSVTPDFYNNVTLSNTVPTPSVTNSPKKLVIDLSLSINESGRNVLDTIKSGQVPSPPIDVPERDYDCPKKIQKEMLTDVDSPSKNNRNTKAVEDIVNFSFSIDKDILSDPFPDLPINPDGPSSLSSKSFTGSLIDIHTESLKESQKSTKLIRQSSYTLLQPSPQLLAHLEVQSMNTGVEMNCISMSESLSNLSSPSKKRRSWDLESAKVKWSSMALELNQKNVVNGGKMNGVNRTFIKTTPKKQVSPPRSRSVVQEKNRRSLPAKAAPKSEPATKPLKKSQSPVRSAPSNRSVAKDPIVTKVSNMSNQKKEPVLPKLADPKPVDPKPTIQPISESEDPATRVRELYEKIQKQQLIQMASLVEKQKKEQILLQQVFEEQNNLLYKQLKTICPKSPIEAKEAWGDKLDTDRGGPVSLSQLINHKGPEKSACESPVAAALTETNNYISHCDDVLKRSKDITSNIKKQQAPLSASRSQSSNGAKIASPRLKTDGSRTRTQSPSNRNTSRRLNYDTSVSSFDEPMLTDRTNDTLADLNVTFPSDYSDEGYSLIQNGNLNNSKDITVVHRSPTATSSGLQSRTPDIVGKKVEDPVPISMGPANRRPIMQVPSQPTPEQRAAATRIVACAKGFLVRRLLRTERVQATVQTIRDALLCALQLHQDREGIRGADVDLHRRLIQQITAACYALHDTFVSRSAAERCALIAADRARRRALAARPPPPRQNRHSDIMSQSHTGAFPARTKRQTSASLMTQSNYETFSGEKWTGATRARYMPSPRRRPWR